MPGSVPKVKQSIVSVVVGAALSWYSDGPNGRIIAREDVDRLGIQVHPMILKLYPTNDAVLQDDNAHILIARTVQSWFEEQEGELQQIPWPEQSPDLNIVETLWSILDTTVRNKFPPPTSLQQLEDVLREEWYKIPLETLRNLYESIPSRTALY
jgi:hypothetical protein